MNLGIRRAARGLRWLGDTQRAKPNSAKTHNRDYRTVHGARWAILLAMTACGEEPANIDRPPLAFAGFDRTITTGRVTLLDGSASEDPEGRPLNFQWALQSKPQGSIARIESPSSKLVELVPDLSGRYVVSLRVDDGSLSANDLLVLEAVPRSLGLDPPRVHPRGCTAHLPNLTESECASTTDPGRLTFTATPDTRASRAPVWRWLRIPPGTQLEDLDQKILRGVMSFTPARPGDYFVSVEHDDPQDTGEPSATLLVISVLASSTAQAPPQAQLSAPGEPRLGGSVLLDGRDSEVSTATTAPLTRAWSLLEAPSASEDRLTEIATGCPSQACRRLTPKALGRYTIALQVSQGSLRGVATATTVFVQP